MVVELSVDNSVVRCVVISVDFVLKKLVFVDYNKRLIRKITLVHHILRDHPVYLIPINTSYRID